MKTVPTAIKNLSCGLSIEDSTDYVHIQLKDTLLEKNRCQHPILRTQRLDSLLGFPFPRGGGLA
jgi:hypothetical protein